MAQQLAGGLGPAGDGIGLAENWCMGGEPSSPLTMPEPLFLDFPGGEAEGDDFTEVKFRLRRKADQILRGNCVVARVEFGNSQFGLVQCSRFGIWDLANTVWAEIPATGFRAPAPAERLIRQGND